MMRNPMNVMVVGANGGIGSAFVDHLVAMDTVGIIHACTRSSYQKSHPKIMHHFLDYDDEGSIESAVAQATQDQTLDLVIVATGVLHHGENFQPEKSLRDLSIEKYQKQFLVNCIGPALVAKYAGPSLSRGTKTVFATLSARVGSVSGNHLGGWYSYRAAKAALNMTIKTIAIEIARKNTDAVILGLHPGTVDTPLSKPFLGNVGGDALFTPDFSATALLDVIWSAKPEQSGRIYAWDGTEINP